MKSHKASKSITAICFALCTAGITALAFAPINSIKSNNDQSLEHSLQVEALRQHINDAAQRYNKLQEEDSKTTQQSIAHIISAAKKRSSSKSKQSSRPFQGFRNVTWAAALGVKQKLGKGEDLTDYTAKALRPCIGLMTSTQSKIQSELEGLQLRSLARSNDFHLEIVDIASQQGIELNNIGMDLEVFAEIHEATSEVVSKAMWAEIGAFLTSLDEEHWLHGKVEK